MPSLGASRAPGPRLGAAQGRLGAGRVAVCPPGLRLTRCARHDGRRGAEPDLLDQGTSRSVVVRAAGEPGDRSSHAHGTHRASGDDGSTQITLLLSLSVSLLLLPWAARHPTFLFGLPLLAVTPVVGQGVRPILREALTSLLKGLRISSGWLLPHDDPAAHHGHPAHHPHHAHHGHGRRPVRDPRTVPHAHPLVEPSGPYSEWQPPAERRASNGAQGGSGSGGSSAAGPLIEPSGPYSEWRPPAERRASSGGLSGFGAAPSSPGGSPAASRSGSFTDRRPQQQQQQQQQQPQLQQQQQHHRPPVDPRDNLDSLEEEEEALWAAAAASLAQGGAQYGPRGSTNGNGGAAAAAASWDEADAAAAAVDGASAQLHARQARDPRVLSREQKVQRLGQQLQQEPQS
ncbi:hypothetical protein Rsub_07929 [Raphidocelis subcapitata]|uniref:Uncharacterized protein n=1 Tax=Raphidocelis subcapitata TaxID=307507 RepID=A0A2V0P5R6_9CHLO|nr:hypothetical protein Rsub_07929 [Raphidocelis subcapitata]|eukprot:GBF95214.1 hypothetical protein Rsub_07929 [Raphidocelis subcapitata]